VALVWHDFKDWDELQGILNAVVGQVFIYIAAAAWIFGGIAIQFQRTAKTGALVLGAVYLAFALMCLPGIFQAPRAYNSWGNIFYQVPMVTGAAIVYARFSTAWRPGTIARIAAISLALCSVSFGLEQVFNIDYNNTLVPKWLPPNQGFWTWATTVAFELAAVALVTNRMTLLATRLLTAMVVLFGLIVWVPIVFSDLHNHSNWNEITENFAIAGATWILADFLGEKAAST